MQVIILEIVWFLLSGVGMGIANVIPGVSGGTLLLLLGTYERFVDVFGSLTMRGFKQYPWRRQFRFIFWLGLGAAVSILAMAKVMSWLLDTYPLPVYLFLIGLIIGSIKIVTEKAGFHEKRLFLYAGAGIGTVALIIFLNSFIAGSVVGAGSGLPAMVAAGFIAASTMVLPGISGSMVLLIAGLYKPVVDSVSNLDMMSIMMILVGALFGITTASRMIGFFLKKNPKATYAFLAGLVIASLFTLVPYESFNDFSRIALSAVFLVAGLILGRLMLKLEKKINPIEEKGKRGG